MGIPLDISLLCRYTACSGNESFREKELMLPRDLVREALDDGGTEVPHGRMRKDDRMRVEAKTTGEWAELEAFANDNPSIKCEDFMFMGRDAKTGLCSYKHRGTRHYLHLCVDAYEWHGGQYFPITDTEAVERVFA